MPLDRTHLQEEAVEAVPRSSKVLHLLAPFLLVVGTLGLSAAAVGPASADQSITSAGPLNYIFASPTLNCAVHHNGDTAGEFYADTACGTLVSLDDASARAGTRCTARHDIPAGGAANQTAYTPVSQSAVTGSGTSGDPYQLVTVADAGPSAALLRLTQTDTYVVGQESYRTDVQVTNLDAAAQTGVFYRAGDCYLQDYDSGYGLRSPDGSVACVASQDPGARIEQWSPITTGSHNKECGFNDVWNRVGNGANFRDDCNCNANIDNGAGLSWSLSLAPGASKTFSEIMTFSRSEPSRSPPPRRRTRTRSRPGDHDAYTITISNPNVQDATLDTITDDLPSGFSYTRLQHLDGNAIADPSGSRERKLTWNGPFTVPGGGSTALHFSVQISKRHRPAATTSTTRVEPPRAASRSCRPGTPRR